MRTFIMLFLVMMLTLGRSYAQLSNVDDGVQQSDLSADSLKTKDVVDPRVQKTSASVLSNLNMQLQPAEPEEIDSLQTKPIKEEIGTHDGHQLSNFQQVHIESGVVDSLLPKPVKDFRTKEEDPVLTNMKTFQVKDGKVHFVMSRDRSIEEREFVLNITMPRTPPQYREEYHTFQPTNQEQKHFDYLIFFAAQGQLDEVESLQKCISQREVEKIKLNYYINWYESVNGNPPAAADPTYKQYHEALQTADNCVQQLLPKVTEDDLKSTQSYYLSPEMEEKAMRVSEAYVEQRKNEKNR